MDGAEALASLGLEPGADWSTIKVAYRDQIRSHHPDLTRSTGDGERAATIIEAYAVLAKLARSGKLPVPAPRTTRAPTPSTRPPAGEAGTKAVLTVPPGALFEQLVDAAHNVGDVSYIDTETRTVQLLVHFPGWPPSQLTCQIDRHGRDTVIVSTLESLDTRPAPPIQSVVARLEDQLRDR